MYETLAQGEWVQVKTQISGLHPLSSQFSRAGLGPRICISNEFPGDVDDAGLGNTF